MPFLTSWLLNKFGIWACWEQSLFESSPASKIKFSLAFLVGSSMLKITFHFGLEI